MTITIVVASIASNDAGFDGGGGGDSGGGGGDDDDGLTVVEMFKS